MDGLLEGIKGILPELGARSEVAYEQADRVSTEGILEDTRQL